MKMKEEPGLDAGEHGPFAAWSAGSIRWVLVALVLVASSARLAAETKIYSWTDDQGVLHFSDSAVPQDAKGVKVMTMRSSPASNARASAIPLELRNNDPSRKFVRAVLDGDSASREVLMVVDTGATTTLIDENLAADLGIERLGEAGLMGVTGSATGWVGRLHKLKVGSEEISDLNVLVGPMPGIILLGMDVLHRLELSVGPDSLYRANR